MSYSRSLKQMAAASMYCIGSSICTSLIILSSGVASFRAYHVLSVYKYTPLTGHIAEAYVSPPMIIVGNSIESASIGLARDACRMA